MFRNVLFPTDGSTHTEQVIGAALALAKALNAEVTGFHALVVHNVDLYVSAAIGMEFSGSAPIAQQDKEAALRYLATIEKAANSLGLHCHTFYEVTFQAPYKAIIHAAEMRGCDAIFMASHGRRSIASVLHTSETTRVATHSRIPVVIFPTGPALGAANTAHARTADPLHSRS